MSLQELGLEAGACRDEVKAAFRRLAMRHHPDHGGDPVRFRRLVEAYEEAMRAAPARRRARVSPRERVCRVLADLTRFEGRTVRRRVDVPRDFMREGGWVYCTMSAQDFRFELPPTESERTTLVFENVLRDRRLELEVTARGEAW